MIPGKEENRISPPFFDGVSRCYPNAYRSDGTFGYYDSGSGYPGHLSAYIYGGLCFSGLEMTWSTGAKRYKFYLHVNEKTRTDSYVYQPDNYIRLVAGAYKLPALNAKDTSGNYYWVKL